ncbi:tudor domain-containing protein [Streptomyces turgidiscabies]|uniref:hypothetical protein n=1 Tax=Streptomyces turgidiscabies TaxID=85558 RepID=UPI0038F793E8
MLSIEVERCGGAYFEPYITDHDTGCVVTFHNDDITEEGAGYLAQAYSNQALRWARRLPGEQRGERIPVAMERRAVLPDRAVVVVEDRPGFVKYTVRADLISARGAESITRTQSERSPDWGRLPALHAARHGAM